MSDITGPGSMALSSLSPGQITFIRSLPKAELHAHLNGCIPLAILQDLASSYNPSALELTISNAAVQAGLEKLKTAVALDEIDDFFKLFPAIYALISTPDALARATVGVLDAFFLPKKDGSGPECTYLELRTTPRETLYMTREVYLCTVLATIEQYLQTLSPLSEPIGHNSPRRRISVIVSLDRRMNKEVMDEIVSTVLRLKREGLGIVGIDLCGDPRAGNVSDWEDVFAKVREVGLGITLHIAEVLQFLFWFILLSIDAHPWLNFWANPVDVRQFVRGDAASAFLQTRPTGSRDVSRRGGKTGRAVKQNVY